MLRRRDWKSVQLDDEEISPYLAYHVSSSSSSSSSPSSISISIVMHACEQKGHPRNTTSYTTSTLCDTQRECVRACVCERERARGQWETVFFVAVGYSHALCTAALRHISLHVNLTIRCVMCVCVMCVCDVCGVMCDV